MESLKEVKSRLVLPLGWGPSCSCWLVRSQVELPRTEQGHRTSITVCPVPMGHRPINRGHVSYIVVKQIHLNHREGACQNEPDEAHPFIIRPAVPGIMDPL